ncbi:phytanoyl-CoA dioxygenase family protein [Candidatus Poribacteria bacterium]|nr:phytanoyl-CoA dioxygenase family protein [Candidatus Poribacteria bacterium]
MGELAVRLTQAQTAFFRHNGFAILPTRLTPDAVQELRDAIWRDIERAVEPVVRSGGRIVRLSNVFGRGGVFARLVTCAEILDPLESLLGPNIEFLRNRHNHATLRVGGDGSAYMHRDVLQWTRTIVTVLVYLEGTNLENGCTRVVPGTHLLPGREANSLHNDPEVEASGLLEQAVPIPMPAGGLVAIDSMIYHGAGENRTSGTRMSLTLGYHSADELAGYENPKRVLVRGARPYHGNDG